MAINGYNRRRSGSIQYIMDPAWMVDYVATPHGTTHAAWNPYDTHIPLLWMGWGIKAGATSREVHITDIAPTLADLLHIQRPNGAIGSPIF
jgi:arylsulfatase A-like enzyme